MAVVILLAGVAAITVLVIYLRRGQRRDAEAMAASAWTSGAAGWQPGEQTQWREFGEGWRTFLSPVVGESFRNPDGTARQDILTRCRIGEDAILEPEPGNRHDSEAVKVLRAATGEQIGYLPRGHDLFDAADEGRAKAVIHALHGGTMGKESRGAVLQIGVRD
ncbi:hypothetical protein FRZ44_38340 [Hypericibacter terrae]|uniref:HIRAN domain-containing protein n=1 Tax=Hypericibacter terrae TaxID=2602015 RepID=A0A5J6MMY9_9PROT|nr:HIRAN domain-containing protein [Hypericibacter terrae]QEX18527.1 hypothetical protein FRZ44_38340 [Hypericibacter terrae]